MYLHSALAYSGLAATLVLLAASQNRGIAVVAVLAAGLEVLMNLNLIHLSISHVPLGLVFGIALAVPALVIWFKATTKAAVSSGAIAAFIGALQIVGYLLPRV